MKKWGTLLLVMLLCLWTGTVCLSAEETENLTMGEKKWSLLWQGISYSGVYTGELDGVYPQGTGVFEGQFSDGNDRKGTITYEGEWAEGKFDGDGVLTDELTNLVYEGGFAEGKLHGQIKEYCPGEETSYTIRNYRADIPVNFCFSFQSGRRTDYDCYFHGISVKKIRQTAKEYSYWPLFYDLDCEYKEICLTCEVNEIHQVVEKDASGRDVLYCKVKVKDNAGNVYLLSYDLTHKQVATNYMPELKVGERLVAYGYCAGTERLRWDETRYPKIDAVCADIGGRESEADAADAQDVYSNFINYSYQYKDRELELNGTFKGIYVTTDDWVYFKVESTDYSEGGAKIYVCRMKNKKKNYDLLPVADSEIHLKGSVRSVSKQEIGDGEYAFYPQIQVTEIISS